MIDWNRRLQDLAEKSPPARPDDGPCEKKLARVLPPIREERGVLAPQLAKPLPSARNVEPSSWAPQPELLDEMRALREEAERRAQKEHRKKMRQGQYKPRKKTPVICSVPFGTWILRQWRRADPVGALVRAFYLESDNSDWEDWKARLEAVGAMKTHVEALRSARGEWTKECRLPATEAGTRRRQL